MTSSSVHEYESQSGFRREFDVLLHGRRVGGIHHRGATVAFAFEDDYREDPDRAVLGLRFEENIGTVHYGNNRIAWWFENLLPEGDLALALGAANRALSKYEKESLLFENVGSDLAGAVQVLRSTDGGIPHRVRTPSVVQRDGDPVGSGEDALRFSVAGVGLKLSMRRSGARFVAPSINEQGSWLLKLPDRAFRRLPQNEYATMRLAAESGIDVPKVALVDRDQVESSRDAWWAGESQAFAIERFDRDGDGSRIHIEDLAQVRGVHVSQKYSGNLETVANLMYRGRDMGSLIEFTRRVAFNLMVGNSDAHLKNWSFRYADGRMPRISPAYDLVSVIGYGRSGVDTRPALRFANRRDYSVSMDDFARMSRKIGATVDLPEVVATTVEGVIQGWPLFEDLLATEGEMLAAVREHASMVVRNVLGRVW